MSTTKPQNLRYQSYQYLWAIAAITLASRNVHAAVMDAIYKTLFIRNRRLRGGHGWGYTFPSLCCLLPRSPRLPFLFSLSFSLILFFTELALLVVWHCEQWEDWNSFYPSWHILFQSFHMDLLWAPASEWSFQHFLQIFDWGAACMCSRMPDLVVEGPSVYKTPIWGHRFDAMCYNTHT